MVDIPKYIMMFCTLVMFIGNILFYIYNIYKKKDYIIKKNKYNNINLELPLKKTSEYEFLKDKIKEKSSEIYSDLIKDKKSSFVLKSMYKYDINKMKKCIQLLVEDVTDIIIEYSVSYLYKYDITINVNNESKELLRAATN